MTETPKITPELTQEQRAESDQEPNDPRKKIEQSNLPQETKDAALTTLDAVQTNTEGHKKPINKKFMINLIVMIGLLGGTTACSESWQRRFDAELDPAKYSDDPIVQRAYNIDLQLKAEQDSSAGVESLFQAPKLDIIDQSYEVVGAKQEFAVGAKVVVDAGGYGINVRNFPSINSSEATGCPDGTIFIIDELLGSRDGHNWALVTTEDGKITGYVATDWLKPLEP